MLKRLLAMAGLLLPRALLGALMLYSDGCVPEKGTGNEPAVRPAKPNTDRQLISFLGQRRTKVREVFGEPRYAESRKNWEAMGKDIPSRLPSRGWSEEEYYSSGVVGTYDEERLVSWWVPSWAAYSPWSGGDPGHYQGWQVPAGPIIEDVCLADSRQAVRKKLGNPTRIADDPIMRDVEVTYYWRRQTYTIAINFLRRPYSLDRLNPRIVAPRDALATIRISLNE